MEAMANYDEWSEEELNQRIFALYDQIEKKTLENLEVAQNNCQLEVQIKTIDDILESYPLRNSQATISSNEIEEPIEVKYENLLENHFRLAERVDQIE
jgi:hypothetical protein